MNPTQYLETQILGATQIELVRLLYRGAIDAISNTRRHLASGDISARSVSVTKALDFVSELALSLDHESGGEVSRNLQELYGYIQHLLITAHAQKSDSPLEEAAGLLNTMLDGWRGIESIAPALAAVPPVEYAMPVVPPQTGFYDPGASCSASRSWNL